MSKNIAKLTRIIKLRKEIYPKLSLKDTQQIHNIITKDTNLPKNIKYDIKNLINREIVCINSKNTARNKLIKNNENKLSYVLGQERKDVIKDQENLRRLYKEDNNKLEINEEILDNLF